MGDPQGPWAVGRLDELRLRLEVLRYQPRVMAALASAAILAVSGVAVVGWWLQQSGPAVPVEDLIPLATVPSEPEPEVEPEVGGSGRSSGDDADARAGDGRAGEPPAEELVVHVVGAVTMPGLVRLTVGSRVADAVAAAVPVGEADLERLNLATPLVDGMQIRVPAAGEELDGALIVGGVAAGPQAPSGVSSDTSSGPAGPVNLNTATDRELQALPGVGPATAAAIIGWRTEHGGFLRIDDLTAVPGIGPAKLAALRDLVTV